MVLSIDLNDVPAESRQLEENATPTDLQHEHPPSHSGSRSIPSTIDADAIDDEVTLLTAIEWYTEAWSQPRRKRPLTISIDENLETNAEHSVKDARQPNPEEEKEASASAAEEPGLICPVCMCTLNEPSSTTCGHVFCSSCIEIAIEKQKKCPACRKKLTKRSFHRIYLPSN